MLISKGDKECPQDLGANLNFNWFPEYKGCFDKAVDEILNLQNG